MRRNRNLSVVLSGVAIVVCSSAQCEEKQPLEYRTSGQPHALVGMLPPKSLQVVSEQPQGVQLPELKSEHPLFARWLSPMAPDGFLWVALDRTSEQGAYDRLFIDSNGDGLLKDEGAVSANFRNQSRAHFGPVKVALKGDEGAVTHHLNFEFVLEAGGPRLSVRSGGWYEGDILVEQKKKHCLLFDQNANGAFDDRAIDLKDSDIVQVAEQGSQDISLVGNFIQVDDELYRLEVARNGAWVRLSPAKDVKFGTVKQRKEMTELTAGGENGMLTVKLKKGGGKLPIGKCRVYGWDAERDDHTGSRWKAKATSFGNAEVFEISEGRETHVDVGEPIVSTIETYRSGAQCTIQHSWRGKSGEWIKLTCNGVEPPPAQVHIWNEDRSYDRTFTFEHG